MISTQGRHSKAGQFSPLVKGNEISKNCKKWGVRNFQSKCGLQNSEIHYQKNSFSRKTFFSCLGTQARPAAKMLRPCFQYNEYIQ